MEIRGEKLDAIGISSEQVDKKYVDSMTVSYGYVFSSEKKWNSVYDIAKAREFDTLKFKKSSQSLEIDLFFCQFFRFYTCSFVLFVV